MIKRSPRFLIFLICILILELLYVGYEHYEKIRERRTNAMSAPAPLRILIEEGRRTCPAIIIYTENFGLGGQHVIVSVWRSGRIVWSKNQHKGGPPYFEGKIPSVMVTKILNELEDSGFLDDPFLNVINLDVSPKLEVISVIAGNKVLCMEASHGFGEDGEDRVYGSVHDSKHYCKAWVRIRNLVGSLIPTQGKEFKFNYKIVRVFRY